MVEKSIGQGNEKFDQKFLTTIFFVCFGIPFKGWKEMAWKE